MADDFLKNAVDQVADIIDSAISSNDYSDLSRKIGSLMRDVVDSAGDAVKSAGDAVKTAAASDDYRSQGQKAAKAASERRARERAERERAAREKAAREREEEKYFAKADEATGSKIMSVIGAAGSVLFGLMTLLMGLFSSLQYSAFSDISGVLAVFMGILTVCSVAMFVSGRRAARKAVRFKSYRNLIMPKLYADVDDLAKQMNLPQETVVKDLEGFTKNGKIRQGHFDDTKTCFIASDELYAQYRSTAERAEKRRQAEAEEAKRQAAFSPEVQEILTKGNEYINMIHRANDEIPDELISEKLDRMELITRKIFDEVRVRPELAGKLNMFMNYYLPTTTKLVTAYKEMDRQPMQGENIRKAKQEIADSLDTINSAFETLLDSFFREQAMDVSSDINVMKMMMRQDGLTEDDMTAKRKARQQAAAQTAAAGQSAAQQTYSSGTAQAAGAVQTEQKK